MPFDKGAEQWELALMPISREAVTTPHPVKAAIAYIELCALVRQHLASWWDCFNEQERRQLQSIMEDLTKDEQAAAKEVRTHRLRRDPTKDSDHVALSLEDYSRLARRIIAGGASILWDCNGVPYIAQQRNSRSEQWGFNAVRLKQRGQRLHWPGQELLHFLDVGCSEYSHDTPHLLVRAPFPDGL